MNRLAVAISLSVLMLTSCASDLSMSKREIRELGRTQVYYIPPVNQMDIRRSSGAYSDASILYALGNAPAAIGVLGADLALDKQAKADQDFIAYAFAHYSGLEWQQHMQETVFAALAKVPWLDAKDIIVTQPGIGYVAQRALVASSGATGAVFIEPHLSISPGATDVTLVLELEKYNTNQERGLDTYDTEYLAAERKLVLLDGGTTEAERLANGHRKHAMPFKERFRIWLTDSPSQLESTLDDSIPLLGKNLTGYLDGAPTAPLAELPSFSYTVQ